MTSAAKPTRASILDRLLHPREQLEIVEAVRIAELNTTSEIKVHVERHCLAPDPYTRAVQLLTELGVHLTADRNGVLIYVAVHDRRYAIVGDVGLGEPADSPFWKEPNRRMSIAFRRGACGAGIVDALRELGPRLAKRFPAQPGTGRNEIENEISTAESTRP